jgi:hypothetical protein
MHDAPENHQQESMPEDNLRISKGLVTWLDILGFKEILKAQSAFDATTKLKLWRKAWDALNSIPPMQDKHGLTLHQLEKLGHRDSWFKTTAFSDSMVISLDMSSPLIQSEDRWKLIRSYLLKNALTVRLMFEAGLPVRGCISYGEFVHADRGFAGKPFVEAEQLSSRLELSACVFSDEAIEIVKQAFKGLYASPSLESNRRWFPFDCPVKPTPAMHVCGLTDKTRTECACRPTPVHERLHVLNIACPAEFKTTDDAREFVYNLKSDDLPKIVAKSFGDHGKAIDHPSIRQKIDNTIRMLRSATQAAGEQAM